MDSRLGWVLAVVAVAACGEARTPEEARWTRSSLDRPRQLVAAGGVVYALARTPDRAATEAIGADGTSRWRVEGCGVYLEALCNEREVAVAASRDGLFVVHPRATTWTLTHVDGASGTTRYAIELGDSDTGTAAVAANADRVAVAWGAVLTMFDAATGEERWTIADPTGAAIQRLAFDGDTLLGLWFRAAGQATIGRWSASDGTPGASVDVSSVRGDVLAVLDDLYVTAHDAALVGVDRDGNERWRLATTSESVYAASPAAARILVADGDEAEHPGSLLAVDLDGAITWSTAWFTAATLVAADDEATYVAGDGWLAGVEPPP